MKRKEMKLAREQDKKQKKKKDIILIIFGVMLFAFAVVQALIVLLSIGTQESGHNQIILGEKVVTSEVCSLWFNESYKFDHTTSFNFYYNDTFQSHPIPRVIVLEVCNKWIKIKKEIDNEINLCKTYSSMDQVKINIINGSKYYNINNRWVLEEDIKEDCKNE